MTIRTPKFPVGSVAMFYADYSHCLRCGYVPVVIRSTEERYRNESQRSYAVTILGTSYASITTRGHRLHRAIWTFVGFVKG